MAARWGAGEETLTIGGMELFAAGGPLQCNVLEEDESCGGLADLALSSLDVGILGTLHGYIDNSIISIIDDNGIQAENKGHFDEENELSLLTALTEILDNADDENMSPFDSIPDSELLVSPKDRDGCSKFLSLTRTPPNREIASVDDHRWLNYAKVDVRCPGQNWDLFPETISSTPKRRTRQSVRAYLPRIARPEHTQERSDGEEEEVHLLDTLPQNLNLLPADKDSSLDAEDEIVDFDNERLTKHGTPCIINTENVPLNDLVKYMHPYCLPSLTVCLDPEDEDLLDEAVFLEIVSEQGECIKVPVIVEETGGMINVQSSEDMPILNTLEDVHTKTQDVSQSTSEQCVPEVDVNYEKNDTMADKELLQSAKSNEDDKIMQSLPEMDNMSTESLSAETIDKVMAHNGQCDTDISVNDKQNSKEVIPDSYKENMLLRKKSAKEKNRKGLKSKTKSKNKAANEVQENVILQNGTPCPAVRSSNPSLQESDFLIKTLDQVKKESQQDLRSSKMTRSKTRSRPSFDSQEKKTHFENIKKEEKNNSVVTEQSKCIINTGSDNVLGEIKTEDLNSQSEGVQENIPNNKSEEEDNIPITAIDVEEVSNEELNETMQQKKESKPKSLSLSEYRKRLQNRKPNPDRENENLCSKWPSLPEPPTELAELPCLVMPAKSNKAIVQEKQSPSKPEISSAQVFPATSTSLPPTIIPVVPVTSKEGLQQKADKPFSSVMDTTLPPLIPSQPNIPPPFFPPAWPNVPSHPPYYSGVPSLPAAPQFPGIMPPIIPMQPPPPIMSWPPFPPPPIAMGPMHHNGWPSGLPPPYWPNQVPQGLPEPPVSFTKASQSVVPDQKIPQDAAVPPVQCSPQKLKRSVQKPENIQTVKRDRIESLTPDDIRSGGSITFENVHTKSVSQVCSAVKKSLSAQAKVETTMPQESKTSPSIPDLKSANEVVIKIMEILKRAQKCGFQIKPPLLTPVQQAKKPSEGHTSTEVTAVKPADHQEPNICAQNQPISAVTKPSALINEQKKLEAATSKAADEDMTPPSTVIEKVIQESGLLHTETPSTTSEALNVHISDQKQQTEELASETGIEASDLTSLLEEFEKSEAKDEERLPFSPDKMAVGNSGLEKPMEKKPPLDKQLAPELVNTAGLTPPATPPHQLWKSANGSIDGKSKTLQITVQEKPCSLLKTAKLIEPKPLPQNKLKKRNPGSVPSVALPAIHVGSGDHDYCILAATCQEKGSEILDNNQVDAINQSSQKEEGSRWNVKHHQNIVIKPIVPFNKRSQGQACPKQNTSNAPSLSEQNISCPSANSLTPCRSIQKDTNYPLDHRTNVLAESAVKSPPGSVLMSPDSSPCHSEHGESRTDVRSENSVSRRSLRCYRKYRNSPSPQKSTWRGRSCGSRSDSSSSSTSSSRSRSRSPPSKRRRTYSSRSHRSQSSSSSSYGSRSSSRSSSGSSRSCSLSSSRSRSRSRSPYRRRYRSRSGRCESRDSYQREKMYHKERAIEERRVVYIGNLNSHMTRTELRRRFSVFGDIEECSIHFREEGDNYGFVTYRYTGEAFTAIENGHKLRLPDELPFDLCFGGRRQFCKSNYADLDSNLDDFDPAPVRSKFEALDFDTLLRQAQKNQRR